MDLFFLFFNNIYIYCIDTVTLYGEFLVIISIKYFFYKTVTLGYLFCFHFVTMKKKKLKFIKYLIV